MALHGGPDASGVARHDLSTTANACGPCPAALEALAGVDPRHYPDPGYTALTVQLAAWHGVAPGRIVLAGSASEFIQRLSVAVALQANGARTAPPTAWWPQPSYVDYARAAHAAGLRRAAEAEGADLQWACDPSSPHGQPDATLPARLQALRPGQTLVLDQAYEPLRLDGALDADRAALDRVWRLITPNKALGLTGVRAAYAIAPQTGDAALLARVRALAPSWAVGAHGVALLQAWASVPAHDWLADCRATLRAWRARQIDRLRAIGWRVQPSVTNFFVAAPPDGSPTTGQIDSSNWLAALRGHGFKLRDAASFGLPGRVRMAVASPDVQVTLLQALHAVESARRSEETA